MSSPKRENLLVNLACNLALPSLIMTKLSAEDRLGPLWSLLIALAFPVGYAIYDFIVRRRMNFVSVAGFVSVLLSGSLGLLKADGRWFAIKDAAVPLAIGVGVVLSARAKTPILQELLVNDQVMDLPRIEAAIVERNAQQAFKDMIARQSFWLAASFALSAALNYSLARYILTSPAGTPEFTAELGRMHLLSWPVAVVPSIIMMMVIFWRLIKDLSKLTGLGKDSLFHARGRGE